MSQPGPNQSEDHPDERKAIRRVNRIISSKIRECMLLHKRADVDTVYDMVEDTGAQTLESVLPALGRSYLRIMIQHRLKHVGADADDGTEDGADTSVPLKKAQEVARSMRDQPDLPGMEEFRNVPVNVSIRLPNGHVEYMPYLDTLKADRIAALELLGKSIEADQRAGRR